MKLAHAMEIYALTIGRTEIGRKSIPYPPTDKDYQLKKMTEDDRLLKATDKYAQEEIVQGKTGKYVDVTPDGKLRTRDPYKGFDFDSFQVPMRKAK